jgi:hypothetical protein
MAQPEPFAELSVDDISVDRDGRITITNPRFAGRLHAAVVTKKKEKPPPPNTNCTGTCNSTKGCGPTNQTCSPTNVVPNCGCTAKATQ